MGLGALQNDSNNCQTDKRNTHFILHLCFLNNPKKVPQTARLPHAFQSKTRRGARNDIL
jgi:hypothetical protein